MAKILASCGVTGKNKIKESTEIEKKASVALYASSIFWVGIFGAMNDAKRTKKLANFHYQAVIMENVQLVAA